MKTTAFLFLFLTVAAVQLSCLADQSVAEGEEVAFQGGEDDLNDEEDRRLMAARENPQGQEHQGKPPRSNKLAAKNTLGNKDDQQQGGRKGRMMNKGPAAQSNGNPPRSIKAKAAGPREKNGHSAARRAGRLEGENQGILDSLCGTLGPVLTLLNSLPGGSLVVSLLSPLISCSSSNSTNTTAAAASTTAASGGGASTAASGGSSSASGSGGASSTSGSGSTTTAAGRR